MLMSRTNMIIHDFNIERQNTQEKNKGYLVISDFSFEINYNINIFLEKIFSIIPSDLRCFTLFYDFKEKIFT